MFLIWSFSEQSSFQLTHIIARYPNCYVFENNIFILSFFVNKGIQRILFSSVRFPLFFFSVLYIVIYSYTYTSLVLYVLSNQYEVGICSRVLLFYHCHFLLYSLYVAQAPNCIKLNWSQNLILLPIPKLFKFYYVPNHLSCSRFKKDNYI